jgi:hypothetical protein
VRDVNVTPGDNCVALMALKFQIPLLGFDGTGR